MKLRLTISLYIVLLCGQSTAFAQGLNLKSGAVFKTFDQAQLVLNQGAGVGIASGATLEVNGDLHLTGDFDNAGTFTANSSTVNLSGTSEQTIKGNNSFNNLTFSAGVTVKLEAGTIQTVTSLDINGTEEHPVTIASTVDGSAATFSQSTGELKATFLNVKDNIATGGATFYAFSSTDLGNNSGWIFSNLTAPVLTATTQSASAILLEWTASNGADFYIIQRKLSSEGEEAWQTLEATYSAGLNFTDTSAAAGTSYDYRVAGGIE